MAKKNGPIKKLKAKRRAKMMKKKLKNFSPIPGVRISQPLATSPTPVPSFGARLPGIYNKP